MVGGNVLTSQRVVDVILGAFGACAASQVRQAGGHSSGLLWGGRRAGKLREGTPPQPQRPLFPCQGCMNNVTLGNAHMGYYETVAGGAGAGPGWHGRSGVHSHMTNTRITDPEILESRRVAWAGLGAGQG